MKIRIANLWNPEVGRVSNSKNWNFTGFQIGITNRMAKGKIHMFIIVANFEFDFEI